jgi:hypothetical protein
MSRTIISPILSKCADTPLRGQLYNTNQNSRQISFMSVIELDPVCSQPLASAPMNSALSAERPNLRLRTCAVLASTTWHLWCLGSLVLLLAFVTAIPLLQLIVLGYLLLVAGRLAGGATIRRSLPGLAAAGQIGIVRDRVASDSVAGSLGIRCGDH